MAHLVLVQGLTGVLNLVKDPVAGGRAGFAMTGYAAAAAATAAVVVVLGIAPTEKILYLVIMLNHRNSCHDTLGLLYHQNTFKH